MSRDGARHTMSAVGAAAVILAFLGLWYNASTLFMDYSSSLKELSKEHAGQYFHSIFYTFWGICVGFYVILFASGIQLIRGRSSWAFVLLTIVILEVIYFFTVGFLWAHSPLGLTVAAASGVSSGGLFFQAIVLFPIWGPFLALWARRKMTKASVVI